MGRGGAGVGAAFTAAAAGRTAWPGWAAITGRGRGVAAGGGGVGAGRSTAGEGWGVRTGPGRRAGAGDLGASRAAIDPADRLEDGPGVSAPGHHRAGRRRDLGHVGGVLGRERRHHDELGAGRRTQLGAEREPLAAAVLVDEQPRPFLAERRGEVRRVGDARGAAETLGEEWEQRIDEPG